MISHHKPALSDHRRPAMGPLCQTEQKEVKHIFSQSRTEYHPTLSQWGTVIAFILRHQSRQAGLEINLNEGETHAKDESAYKESQQ